MDICIDYKEIFASRLSVPPGPFADCYAFSIHKAGSSLLHGMIDAVCAKVGIPSINIPDTLFNYGIHEEMWCADNAILELVKPGYVYFGFRVFPKIFADRYIGIKEKKSVLLVRDPRDALVSQYFSFGRKDFSHVLPARNAEALVEKWMTTASLTIDKYVLSQAQDYLRKMNAYRDLLCLQNENVLLRRYEDIYYNKVGFIRDTFNHFGICIEKSILDEVAASNDIRPAVEDPSKHIRKGTPGDHKEKLSPQTIRDLNAIFKETAAFFGYNLGEC